MFYADNYCQCVEVYTPKHAYRFTGPCIQTNKLFTVEVPATELYAYRQGALIQTAMKSVSADGREFLMSGLSPEAFATLCGDEE